MNGILILDQLDQLPPVLYKFRTFGKYTTDLVQNGSIYFAPASSFNDPLDCHFVIDIEHLATMSEMTLKRHVFQEMGRIRENLTRKEKRALAPDALKRIKKQIRDPKSALPVIKESQNKYGIFCASGAVKGIESWQSLPMWAHYAVGHEGVCIGLSTEAIGRFQEERLRREELLMFDKVKYSDSVPSVTLLMGESNDADEIAATFFTKSKQWRYEEEYRLIYWDHPSQAVSLGPDAVVEVIFGAKSSEADRQALCTALRETNPSAKVYRAKPLYGQYGMGRELYRC